MPSIHRRIVLSTSLIIPALLALLWFTPGSAVATESVPKQISDGAFWQMVTDFSEPGGYFRSDNFVSNETTFQWVIPQLKKVMEPGGVYLGVGPDQNFTYIVALQPTIAFIVDIRRQNMIQHLMYKALMELSADRAEFLSRLFSRKRPPDLGASSSAEVLFDAYDSVEANPELFEENLRAILDRLVKHHGFKLASSDEKSIEYVYGAFFDGGPDLTYNGPGFRGGGRRMPTYAELMMETDGRGQNLSYMATEENFRILQDLERNNLVVPLVGDFAGDRAIRSVGAYLKEHDATVTAIYTSNVEQYLFQQSDDWRKYYANVATLPVDPASTFIRAVFNMGVGFNTSFGMRTATLLSPIAEFVNAFNAGRVTTYYDVVEMSK